MQYMPAVFFQATEVPDRPRFTLYLDHNQLQVLAQHAGTLHIMAKAINLYLL